MKKSSRILCALVLMALVFLVKPAHALAYSGLGSEADPYVVMTYDELRDCMASGTGTFYIRLGADILSDDTKSKYMLMVTGSNVVCNLDLAGHSVARKSTGSDLLMVEATSSATLVISDSVGEGSITSDLSSGSTLGSMLYVSGGGTLIVNGGSFISLNGKCILSQGGPVTINDGYFQAKNAALERDYGGALTVNGGSFAVTAETGKGINFNYGDACSITNCTIYTPGSSDSRAIYMNRTGSEKLSGAVIPARAKITVDGSSYTLGSENAINGKVVEITSQEISAVSITGLNKPVAGQHPDCTATITTSDGSAVQATIVWYSSSGTWGGTAMTESDLFHMGYTYSCTIRIDAVVDGTWFPISPERDAAGHYDVYAGNLTVNGETIAGHVSNNGGTLNLNWMNGSEAEPYCPFTDVPESAYYYLPVAWAVDQGITSGTSATTFSPMAECTRGQIVTFLWRAAGEPVVTGSNPFQDVRTSDYFYDAVLWAVSKGITYGTDNTHFSPGATCTRGQVVTFLHRAAGAPTVAGAGNPFVDVSPADYYYEAVLWAVDEGITHGTDSTHFSPAAACTRGQVATFLYNDLYELVS